MPNLPIDTPAYRKPLRLWPGVVIVALQWLLRFIVPTFVPNFTIYGVLAALAGGMALVVWWLFFSRAAWVDRLGGIALIVLGMFATWSLADVSIATGAMGAMLPMVAMPGICLAFVLALLATRGRTDGVRRVTMAVAIFMACGVWALVRTGGFTGSFENDLAWRWTPTPEARLVAQGDEGVPAAPAAPSTPAAVAAPSQPLVPQPGGEVAATVPSSAAAVAVPEWPGFRGRDRDSIVHGPRINTDWAAAPPVELWRRQIGPGWSSFSVNGDFLYTQEQRGEDEVVASYRVSTGAPVWKHRDAARFWESNGGAGPRGTPTLGDGRVYALGATGILNVLEAADGRLVWSRNVSTDTSTKIPDWGFASSPSLVGDLVIVAAEGKLAAYDRATGTPRWAAQEGGLGYSSPHLATIHGVPQILLVNGTSLTSVTAADGKRLWTHALPAGAPIVQPGITADGDLLVGDGEGMRRITVKHGPNGWTTEERWHTNRLKPYFNDFVVHQGYAFGFDGAILACVDLANGERKWKGGRYGNGQLILLPDQDALLVLSEDGEIALVSAGTDQFTELARRPAIEGKTWNHPVLVGDILLVRNGEEMAAFKLPLVRR